MNAKLLSLILGAAVLLGACSNVCDIEQAAAIVPGSADDFRANVPDKVYFDFDSSNLSDSAKKRIEAQSCWMNTYTGTKVTVQGHTDVRGTAEYNMALGDARANSVVKELKANGVAGDRVTVVSYGKERIAVDGTDEEAHAKNRRAVTVVE